MFLKITLLKILLYAIKRNTSFFYVLHMNVVQVDEVQNLSKDVV